MFGLHSGFAEIRKKAALFLCAALLLNTIPMNVYAADGMPAEGYTWADVSGSDCGAENNQVSVSASDFVREESQADVSGSDAAAELPEDAGERPEEVGASVLPGDIGAAGDAAGLTGEAGERPEEVGVPVLPGDIGAAGDEAGLQEDTVVPEKDREQTDAAELPGVLGAAEDAGVSEGIGTAPDGADILTPAAGALPGTVSGSDLLLGSAALFAAAAGGAERLELDVTYPSGTYNSSTKILTPKSYPMNFYIGIGLTGTTLQEPILEVQIPSCMTIKNYPQADNTTLKPSLASGSSVSKSGNTLTYKFKEGVGWVNFTIDATIDSGSRLTAGASYDIVIRYYDGRTLVGSDTSTFKIAASAPPTLTNGSVYADTWYENCYLRNENYYYINYDRMLYNNVYNHNAYSSLTMVALIPDNGNVVPGTRAADGTFTELRSGRSVDFTDFKVTYQSSYNGMGKALIYELKSGATFLEYGYSCSLAGIVLRYRNPVAGTYTKGKTPKIDCVINGSKVNMKEHTDTTYESMTFKDLPKGRVYPCEEWSDIIYLQNGQSDYYTNEYVRQICVETGDYGAGGEHTPYDSIEMTVLLPIGAEPCFGRDEAARKLVKNKAYTVGAFNVTYKDYSYSGKTYPALVYVLPKSSNETILTREGYFTFKGTYDGTTDNRLYLKFTNPDPDRSPYTAPSPMIRCIAGSKTVAGYYEYEDSKYNFNDNTFRTIVTVIKPPEDSGVYSDFVEYGSKAWSDEITMVLGQSDYYTKLYNRALFTSDPNPHYPYEWVRMTVLLPDEAEPGFGTGEAFSALADGTTYTVSAYDSASRSYINWTVTYRASYAYSDDEGNNSGTAKALIYELSDPKAAFLGVDGKYARAFSFTGSTQNLYLHFRDPVAGTYTGPGVPKVECGIAGVHYIGVPYFRPTTMDTAVKFNSPKVDWKDFSLDAGTNATAYGLDAYLKAASKCSWVIPEKYQDDKVYYGRVRNDTKYTLKNIRVSYTFDAGLGTDRLEFPLGGSGYPSGVSVTYNTAKGVEETVSLTEGNNKISLEGDVILKADVVYDALVSSTDYKDLLIAHIHNYDKIDESAIAREIKAEGISAGSQLDEGASGDPDFQPKQASMKFGLKSRVESLTASVSLDKIKDKTTLQKGDNFTVKVTTGGYTYQKYENLRIYLRMPRGYILTGTGYTPPSECSDAKYAISSRSLEENGDVLWCLEYRDGAVYGGGIHAFEFRVGPEADTAVLQENINMPKAVYAAAGDGALFQFYNPQTEEKIGLDVNGDKDTDDLFYVAAVPRITVLALGVIMVDGYLTSDRQVGEDTRNYYGADSKGGYRLYLYNGTGSIATAYDGIIKLTMPRKGQKYGYSGEKETGSWDTLLTGPVKLTGDFFEDAVIKYSTDDINCPPEQIKWMEAGQQLNYGDVTYILVQTASGRQLDGSKSAYIDFNFAADFSQVEPGGGELDTFVDMEMEYSINVSSERVSAFKTSTLSAVDSVFKGTIFNDRNGNWTQDAGEKTGNLYTLTLYSGVGTSGAVLQDNIATAANGSYQFAVLLPGTYTLHVNRDAGTYCECNAEGYMEDCVFDRDGNCTFTIAAGKVILGTEGDAALEKDQMSLGIVTPRTLEVTPAELALPLCGRRTLVPELSPELFPGEKVVSFVSRDKSVANADQKGVVSYAGGGKTYVDVMAPQLPAVIVLGAGDGYKAYVTKAVPVTTEGLLPPRFHVFPLEPDGENGWYISVPEQLSLQSGYEDSGRKVDTFWTRTADREERPEEDAYHRLAADNRPTVSGSDIYVFTAYNEAADAAGNKFRSDREKDAVLELKVDVTKPEFAGGMNYRVVNTGKREKLVNFLSFGNFFNEALEITVVARDEHSGVDKLWYRLPGEEDYQSVEGEITDDGTMGSFIFRIPLNTDGQIVYYVKDRAGNRSDPVCLKKDAYGAVLWVVEDQGPVWSELVPMGEDDCEGFKGADGKLWFPGPVSVLGRVNDKETDGTASSGLASVSLSINGAASENVWSRETEERIYTYDMETRPIEEEGIFLLRAFAEDNAGNVSDAETVFGIDLSDPVIEEVGKKLVDGVPYATVRISDVGSGINPDTIRLQWGYEDISDRMEIREEDGYTISFSIWELNFAENKVASGRERILDPSALGFWVMAEDYAGRQEEKLVTPLEIDPVHVSVSRGNDETGNGTREYPFRTADRALERAIPNGTVVLLEDYRNVITVNQKITLNLNGQEVKSEAPGSSIIVGSRGKLTVTDDSGAEDCLGFEGRVFGGSLGDPAFGLREGAQLCIAGGTIYCGCEGSGAFEVREPARMMYLMTYRADADQATERSGSCYQYVQENMRTVLRENMFNRQGFDFAGWIYEGGFRQPGQTILMPGRNIVLTAKWDEIRTEERGRLDPVPKTGEQKNGETGASRVNGLEVYIRAGRNKEEQDDC